MEGKRKCFAKNAEKRTQNELNKLQCFFCFLRDEKKVKTFDESFFDQDRVKIVEEFFESLQKPQFISTSKSEFGCTLAEFFQFCLEKMGDVFMCGIRKENAGKVIERAKNESSEQKGVDEEDNEPKKILEEENEPKSKAKRIRVHIPNDYCDFVEEFLEHRILFQPLF